MNIAHAIIAAAWIIWGGINYANAMQLISRGYDSQVNMAKWHLAGAISATLLAVFL